MAGQWHHERCGTGPHSRPNEALNRRPRGAAPTPASVTRDRRVRHRNAARQHEDPADRGARKGKPEHRDETEHRRPGQAGGTPKNQGTERQNRGPERLERSAEGDGRTDGRIRKRTLQQRQREHKAERCNYRTTNRVPARETSNTTSRTARAKSQREGNRPPTVTRTTRRRTPPTRRQRQTGRALEPVHQQSDAC